MSKGYDTDRVLGWKLTEVKRLLDGADKSLVELDTAVKFYEAEIANLKTKITELEGMVAAQTATIEKLSADVDAITVKP